MGVENIGGEQMADISKIKITTDNNITENCSIKDQVSREKVLIDSGSMPTPTQNTIMTVNLTRDKEVQIPEVKDYLTNNVDCWSSRKISDEFVKVFKEVNILNKNAIGLQADFENNTFVRLCLADSNGSAADFDSFSIYNKRRRCNVADDGTINAFYGDAGYTEDGSNGQVMVIQPKFYYRVEPLKVVAQDSGIGYHLYKANYYISEKRLPGFKLHPAFYDDNDNELEYYLIGAFEGWGGLKTDSNAKLNSIAGEAPNNYQRTRADFEIQAGRRGSIWHNCDIKIWSAEQFLMIIEFGQFNMQNAIGGGLFDGTFHATGQTFGNLTNSTEETDYDNAISYRGVENPWGNTAKHIDGINISGTDQYSIPFICNTKTFVENTTNGYTNANFTIIGSYINGNVSFINYFGYSEDCDWLFIASQTGGNSSLPVGDAIYNPARSSVLRTLGISGLSTQISSALYFGIFSYFWDQAPSNSYSQHIGRLCAFPDATSQTYLSNLSII